jgi:hypothetical protein
MLYWHIYFAGGDESSSTAKTRRQFGRRLHGNCLGLLGKKKLLMTLNK